MNNAVLPKLDRAAIKALRPHAMAVLALRLRAQAIRAQVDEVAAAILRDDVALFDDAGERILEPARYWLAKDDAALAAYYAAQNQQLRAAGIKPAQMPDDNCPALVAEHAVIKAERQVAEGMAELVGLEPHRIYGVRHDEFLDLAMKAVMAA
jgi:hypothetical protein